MELKYVAQDYVYNLDLVISRQGVDVYEGRKALAQQLILR